ncbi:MAG: hypothetical protein KDN20_12640 [Verrucomicrobiae bacterium]|nr:hypothetical protein [Verrucomicrobiae bacterium]
MTEETASPSSSEALKPKRASRKRLKVVIIIIALIPTAVAVLAFPVKNYFTEASWDKFRNDWEAQGEVFDLNSLLDSPIPDEENFAKAPIIEEIYRLRADEKSAAHIHAEGHDHDHAHDEPVAEAPAAAELGRLASLSVFSDGRVIVLQASPPIAFLTGNPVDLSIYLPAGAKETSPVAYLRDIFTPREAIIAELMEAAARSDAYFPVNLAQPSATELSHFPALIPGIHSLRLHNLTLLESGPEFRDLAADRLAGSLRVIRFGTDCQGLAAFSVRTLALESAGLEVVWHALYQQSFTDAQWAKVDQELRAFEFGPRLLRTLRFERSAMVQALENAFDAESARPFAVPPAWVQMNGLIEYAELTQRYWFTDAAGGRLLKDEPRLEQIAAIESIARGLEQSRENAIVAMGILPVHDFAVRAAWIESQRDHALISIAIERHRLAHGSLPEKLSQLVPDWMEALPINAVTGQSPRFELIPAAVADQPAIGYRLRTFGDHPEVEDPIWVMPVPGLQ